MTWAWALLWVERLELLPGSGRDVIFMEIIDAVISIVAAKDINTAAMYNCSVAIPGAGRLSTAVRVEFTPGVSREIETEEVVPSIRTIIASKDVEVVVHSDRSVQRSRTRRVNFV